MNNIFETRNNNPFHSQTGNPFESEDEVIIIDNWDYEGEPRYVLVPEGEYAAECSGAKQKTLESSGRCVVLSFKITEGEYAGQEVSKFFSLKPAAMWSIQRALKALGISDKGERLSMKPSDVKGKQCKVVVEHYSSEPGKKKASVQRVIGLDE